MAKSKKSAKASTKKKSAGSAKKASKQTFDLAAALAALPPEAAEKAPDQTTSDALQDARDVLRAVKSVQAKLEKLPGVAAHIASLPVLLEAAEEAQHEWTTTRAHRRSKEFKTLLKSAEKLRSDLVAAGRYLLRKNDEAQRVLDLIAEGDGLADLVADLKALARFAELHAEALASATLADGPAGAAKQAISLAKSIEEGLSDAHADTSSTEKVRTRNKHFVLLGEAVSEVRAAARYALRGSPELLRPFRAPSRRSSKPSAATGKPSAAVGTPSAP